MFASELDAVLAGINHELAPASIDAFFVADPELMIELAGPVMRASRGSLLALCDVDQSSEPAIGRVFPQGIRYFKGSAPPPVGDLSYSELAVFGP